MSRKAFPLLILALVVTLAAGASPASAAPAKVGLVSFVGASTTSLTLSWPSVSNASGYEIFRSTHTSMASATKIKTTSRTSATITGLAQGRTYCFQVRAKAGSSVGSRSVHTCKPTIRAQGPITGAPYSVMTFNACSDNCSGWGTRQGAVRSFLQTRQPDVLATQEAGSWTTPPPGYAQADVKYAKRLFYKTSRFTLATSGGGVRAGSITMGPNRYAVWAELVDRATSQRIFFVDAHTSFERADYALRGREVENLLAAMGRINTEGRQVVYAGDFNSNKNRGTYDEATGFGSEDTVSRAFAAAGYYDAYDLARTLKRPNWNSFSGLSATPTISRTWGDHVDHVYVVPDRANVYRWMNAALYSGSRYAAPIPSDHRPVQVDLYLS